MSRGCSDKEEEVRITRASRAAQEAPMKGPDRSSSLGPNLSSSNGGPLTKTKLSARVDLKRRIIVNGLDESEKVAKKGTESLWLLINLLLH